MRCAELVWRLGTPASPLGEVMWRWSEHHTFDLLVYARRVRNSLTDGLEPDAEDADERERRYRPTIQAAERVLSLLEEHVS